MLQSPGKKRNFKERLSPSESASMAAAGLPVRCTIVQGLCFAKYNKALTSGSLPAKSRKLARRWDLWQLFDTFRKTISLFLISFPRIRLRIVFPPSYRFIFPSLAIPCNHCNVMNPDYCLLPSIPFTLLIYSIFLPGLGIRSCLTKRYKATSKILNQTHANVVQ